MRIAKIMDDNTVDKVLLKVQEGVSIPELAEEYGIGKTTIRDWVTGRHRTGKDFNPAQMTLSEHRKIKQLEKENKALYELIGEMTVELKKQKSDLG